MRELAAYTVIAVASSIYASWLQTGQGKTWIDRYTTIGTIAGVSLVLFGLLFLIPPRYWLRVAAAFAAGGLPMVVRFVIRHSTLWPGLLPVAGRAFQRERAA